MSLAFQTAVGGVIICKRYYFLLFPNKRLDKSDIVGIIEAGFCVGDIKIIG